MPQPDVKLAEWVLNWDRWQGPETHIVSYTKHLKEEILPALPSCQAETRDQLSQSFNTQNLDILTVVKSSETMKRSQ